MASIPHHCRHLGGGGTGLKPSDYQSVPLCHDHHDLVHQKGWSSLNLDMVYLLLMMNRYLTDYILKLKEAS